MALWSSRTLNIDYHVQFDDRPAFLINATAVLRNRALDSLFQARQRILFAQPGCAAVANGRDSTINPPIMTTSAALSTSSKEDDR